MATTYEHFPIYLMLGINTVASLLILYRYISTKVPAYLWIFLSTLLIIMGDALRLVFHLRIGYGSEFLSFIQGKAEQQLMIKGLALFISAFVLLTLGQVLFDVVTVQLLRQWITSVEASPRLTDSKRSTANKLAGIVYGAFPLAGILYSVAFSALLIAPTSRTVMGWVALIGGFMYFGANVLNFIVCIWLWLSIRGGGDQGHLSKRNQMMRLVFLSLFSDSALYYKVGSLFSVFWIVRIVLVVWPGALVGYDEPLEVDPYEKKASQY